MVSLDKLQAESDETFDRTKIVVKLSSAEPFKAEAFFTAGSGVGIADAHAIAAVLDACIGQADCFVTPANEPTQYPIVLRASASHATPPQTMSPSAKPPPPSQAPARACQRHRRLQEVPLKRDPLSVVQMWLPVAAAWLALLGRGGWPVPRPGRAT